MVCCHNRVVGTWCTIRSSNDAFNHFNESIFIVLELEDIHESHLTTNSIQYSCIWIK